MDAFKMASADCRLSARIGDKDLFMPRRVRWSQNVSGGNMVLAERRWLVAKLCVVAFHPVSPTIFTSIKVIAAELLPRAHSPQQQKSISKEAAEQKSCVRRLHEFIGFSNENFFDRLWRSEEQALLFQHHPDTHDAVGSHVV